MVKKSQIQNLEVFISTEKIKRDVYNGVRIGKYRKLASRLYTTNLLDTAEAIVQRNIWSIVGQFSPGALVTDRTALENKPSAEGFIYLISNKTREIKLPGGFTIKSHKGFAPLSSDRPFMDNLFLSSLSRAFLENMRPSRTYDNQLSRTLSQKEIEEKLEQFLQRGSQNELNKLVFKKNIKLLINLLAVFWEHVLPTYNRH